jgi:hypothetical protein
MSMSKPIPNIPAPSSPLEADRWDHTRLRRRLLEGNWGGDLADRYRQHMGSTRTAAHGELDLSSNPFRVIARELAVLYDRPPHIRHDEEERADVSAFLGPEGEIVASGLWAQAQWLQARVIGCREYLVRVTADERGVRFRPVPPDKVVATAMADQPDQPDSIRELRLREVDGKASWCWDVLDIRDPSRPIFQVVRAEQQGRKGPGEDITTKVLGGDFSGDAYPYRKADGTPVLPYVLFHAQRSGDRLWDAWEGMEVVEGSLNLAVAWSFWFHCLKDASWPQRYLANLVPAGLGVTDADDARRAEVITDPASVLILESGADGVSETGQPMVGQWQSAADIESLERAISAYAARLTQDAGVPPSDIQRLNSSRSGYAIALTNEGKRQAQRRYAPQFAAADALLISLTAIMLNRVHGSSLPESGYAVVYQEIPLSAQELEGRRKHVVEMLEAGLMDRVAGYRTLHPGLTEAQAKADLAAIKTQDDPEVEPINGGPAPLALVTDAAEGSGVDKLQDTALNGAQVLAAQSIVASVSAGQLPRATGVQMLSSFFNLPPVTAEAIMGSVGRTFTPTPIA